MSTVILTVGIPASGKSTWAQSEVADRDDVVIVCRDDIRAAHGLRSGEQESRVTRIHRAQIEAALLDGNDVIVADTNINKRFRNQLIKFAHEMGADVLIKPFPISMDSAIQRDLLRGPAMVGPDVIAHFSHQVAQQVEAGDLRMDEETFLPVKAYKEYSHGNKPSAIIVDIDGTVARHVARSPYDYSKVSTDEPIYDVLDVVYGLFRAGFAVIFVSGREDSCMSDTLQWLEDNSDFEREDFTLHMRKSKDMRPDWIIKNEIYDNFVLPEYNVVMVFDDRDQVVRHLRRRGITVAQVAPGRF